MGILRRLAIASLEICSYIGRLDSLSQAPKWLETCVENHKDCAGASGQLSSFSPTRLIYIPGDFASCGVQILMKGDKRRPLKAPDMTLSHCWGGHQSGLIASLNATLRKRESLLETFQKYSKMPSSSQILLGWTTCGLTVCASCKIAPLTGRTKPAQCATYTCTQPAILPPQTPTMRPKGVSFHGIVD